MKLLLIVCVAMATLSLVTSSPMETHSACKEASGMVEDLQKYDKTRRDDGIDVSVADIASIQPVLLSDGDAKSQLADDLKELTVLCKVLKNGSYAQTLQDVLNSGHPKCADFTCPFTPPTDCATAPKFRKADGSCNNVANPLWGSAGIPFTRKRPPMYDDGCGSPRTSGLPGARVVSEAFHTPATSEDPPANKMSALYTSFGQFLANDMSKTPTERGDEGIPLNCCPDEHESKCFNIDIPGSDLFFQPRTCMPFKRSVPSTDLGCQSCTREQLNMVTSFIDASPVYGDSTARTNELRILDSDPDKKGALKVSGINLLPIASQQNPIAQENGFNLFKAGASTVNANHGLLSISLMWHRGHNLGATRLRNVNPHWDDERVFQETRRLTIAILQHLTYNEYLRVTLPDAMMIAHDLHPKTGQDFYGNYDNTVDPTIQNVFSAASMRFGHSMVSDAIRYADSNLDLEESSLPLDQTFFRPLTYMCREMDVNRGKIASQSQDMDRHFVPSMRNNLFRTSPINGMDITALNIQRGRDHGLAPYHLWRDAYGLSGTTPGVYPDHSVDDKTLLNTIYSTSSGAADLYSAMVSETPLTDRPVGPLVAAMLADQFQRIKQGDRYWYETNEAPQGFSGAQLAGIRNITMASAACLFFDLDQVQQQPFLVHHLDTNPMVDCDDFTPAIDWNDWAEVK